MNYNCNVETHRIDPLPALTFGLSLPVSAVTAHSFPEAPALRAELENGTLRVENAGIYTILELK